VRVQLPAGVTAGVGQMQELVEGASELL